MRELEEKNRIVVSKLDPKFKDEVASTVGGERIKRCFQCGIRLQIPPAPLPPVKAKTPELVLWRASLTIQGVYQCHLKRGSPWKEANQIRLCRRARFWWSSGGLGLTVCPPAYLPWWRESLSKKPATTNSPNWCNNRCFCGNLFCLSPIIKIILHWHTTEIYYKITACQKKNSKVRRWQSWK